MQANPISLGNGELGLAGPITFTKRDSRTSKTSRGKIDHALNKGGTSII